MSLTCTSFTALLQQSCSFPAKYLCKKNDKYFLFDGTKALASKDKSNKLLSFRQIILLAYQFKESLLKSPSEAQIVNAVLIRMRRSKQIKVEQKPALVKISCLFFEKLQNLFSGFGWKATETLAKALIDQLQPLFHRPSQIALPVLTDTSFKAILNHQMQLLKNSGDKSPSKSSSETLSNVIKPLPSDLNSSPAVKVVQNSPKISLSATADAITNSPSTVSLTSLKDSVKRPIIPLAKSSLSNSALSLKNYKDGACSQKQLLIVFGDILQIQENGGPKPLNSLVYKMKQLSGLDAIDLAHPLCTRMVLDTLKTKNILMTEELVEWLVNEKTFHQNLFLSCLETINREKTENNKKFYPRTIELLLKSYSDREWNKNIPLHTEVLLNALVFLLMESHGSDDVKNLCEKFLGYESFNAVVFKRLMAVFKDKERELSRGAELIYPIRDLLIEHLKKNLEERKPWVEALLADDSRETKELFTYLRSKDSYFSGL